MVIGYGNPSRGDDGVAHHVVDALRQALAPCEQTKLVKAHQLDIALAEEIASQDMVVFVDAAMEPVDGEALRVLPLHAEPAPPTDLDSHSLTPASLLSLTGWLYERIPEAVIVALTGQNFSFGPELSATARSIIPQAVSTILRLLSGAREQPTPLSSGPLSSA